MDNIIGKKHKLKIKSTHVVCMSKFLKMNSKKCYFY